MKSQPKPKLQGLAEGGMVKPTGPFSVKSRKQLDDEQHQRMMEDHSKINELEPMKDAEEDNVQHPEGLESDNDQMKPSEEEIMADHFAEGGEVESPEMEEAIEHAASIAAAIMSKRKMMAEGGEVELEHNAEEEPNNADEMNMDALGKENYSESEGLDELDQPEDSNEHGHKLEDEHDKSIAGRI